MGTVHLNLGYRIEEGFPLSAKGVMVKCYTFQIMRHIPGSNLPLVHFDGKSRGLWFKSRWAADGCAKDMMKWALDELRRRGVVVKEVGT